MKTTKIVLLAFAALLIGIGARVVSAVTTGNEWFPLQTYHGGVVHVPITKTAAFTLANTEHAYDLNSSGGAYTVSLPNSTTDTPADGQCWTARLTVAGNAVTFSPSAVGDLLNGTQGGYNGMDALGDSLTICYDAETTNYNFQSRYIN